MDWFKDKNRRAGVLGTIFFHLLLILVLALVSLKPPFPPPPQIGVEVNLGSSDNGMGDIQPEKPQEVSSSKPQTTSQKVDNVVNQSTEESINLTDKKQKNTEVKPKVEEKPVEKVVNNNFLFPTNKNTKGGNEGNDGKPGDKGKKGGDPNAKNYVGDGGKGGVTFSLTGRNAKSLPRPSTGFHEEGTVEVKVWVNKYGKVTNAQVSYEQGTRTTTTSNELKKRAVDAAMKAQFDSKADAQEVQTGTITYVFLLTN